MQQLLCRVSIQQHALQIVLFIFWIVCGCAAVRPQPHGIPPIKDSRVFLRDISHEYTSIKHFSALCRMKITTPRGSLRVKGVVAGVFPACLRIEMFAFLNQLAFVFATDGSAMSLFLPSQNAFYTGKAADDHLAFLYGTDIRLQEAISLFLGYTDSALSDDEPPVWQYDNGQYLFRIKTGGNRLQEFWIDYGLKKITRYRLYDAAGSALCEFLFSDFRPSGACKVPYAAELYFNPSQTRINLAYSELDTVLPPTPRLFTLSPPARAGILPLEDLSRSLLLQTE